MQKAHIVYDGRIIEKYEFEMRVEEVELTPENGFKRFEPGECSWRYRFCTWVHERGF